MENDRYLITKKVNLAALPDPSKKQATVGDPSQIPLIIERSAQEVHEAYMKRIEEIKLKKKADEEAKK